MNRKHDLLVFSTLHLLIWLPFSSYVALIPVIAPEWGLSNGEAATVFSAYLLGSALASVLVVPITDRVQPQLVLIAGAVMLTGSHMVFPVFANDFFTAAALRVLGGAGQICVLIPGVRLVSASSEPHRRGTAVGTYVAAAYLGSSLSYVITGWLLDQLGSWRGAYSVVSLVSGLAALALILSAQRGAREAGPDRTRKTPRLQWQVLRYPALRLATAAYAFHTAELYLARLWLPLLLAWSLAGTTETPADVAGTAAVLSGLMFGVGFWGVYLGGRLSDRIGRTRTAILAFAVSGACSACIGWLVYGPTLLIILVGFLLGLATAGDSAIYATAVVELAPEQAIGSAQAVQTFVGYIVGSLAPVVSGVLLDTVHSPHRWGLAFSFNALLALAGMGVLLQLRRAPASRQMATGLR